MAVVTCHTEGCENSGIPLDIETTWIDENGVEQQVDGIACGVCGEPISDVI